MSPAPSYEEVLVALRRTTRSMENNPPAFEAVGEESLRSTLVAALDAAFSVGAGAEALHGNGKTDILVRYEQRTIFIGECKIWGGAAALEDAIDQLLGYGTWRDHGLALVVFIRGKQFRRAAERALAAVEAHSSFLGWEEVPASLIEGADGDVETLSFARFRQSADPDGETKVAVLLAHLPTARAERIGGEVDDIGEGIGALLGLRDELLTSSASGISYRASMGAATAELPPEPGSMLRYEISGPHGRAAIDAIPENPDAAARYGPAGALVPEAGQTGERARRLITEALQHGVGVEVRGGFRLQLNRYPPEFQRQVEELEGHEDLRLVLRPSTEGSLSAELHVRTERGEVTVETNLWAVEPPEGALGAMRTSFHNVSLTLVFMRDDAGALDMQLSWKLHPTDARVRDRLAALDLLYAMSGNGTLSLRPHGDASAPPELELIETPLDQTILFERAFFADVVTIEDWIGRPIDLPEEASADEVREIAGAAAMIRAGRTEVSWDWLEFSVPEASVDDVREDWTVDDMPVPLESVIFGETIALGHGKARLNFDVESVEPIPEQEGQVRVRIVPHDTEARVAAVRELQPPSHTS